jgi:acyl-CoA thioester hydrolase
MVASRQARPLRTDSASPRGIRSQDGASFVIASLSLTLLAEIHWPGRVDIGTGVTRIGNSSLSLAQGLFQAGRCVATAETTVVQVDRQSGRSCPLSASTRAFLQRYALDAAQKATDG